jgi:hypothetical protein
MRPRLHSVDGLPVLMRPIAASKQAETIARLRE